MSNGHSVTVGGERLGSGKKMKAYLHNYERSTHDLGYTWRSTMAAGTLVPFMSELALPGDTFDIDLNVDVLTHPTIGPLFGSYKVQLDVFQIPMRLYNGDLHMNKLNIGLKMSDITIPQVLLAGKNLDATQAIDNQQVNPSSIFSYLGISGLGYSQAGTAAGVSREFNAIPYLAYWDIYKQYYANKQEEVGFVIHRSPLGDLPVITSAELTGTNPVVSSIPINPDPIGAGTNTRVSGNLKLEILLTGLTNEFEVSNIILIYKKFSTDTNWLQTPITELFTTITVSNNIITCTGPISNRIDPTKGWQSATNCTIGGILVSANAVRGEEPVLVEFPLENIDSMRENILRQTGTQVYIYDISPAPYGLPLKYEQDEDEVWHYSLTNNQEGLAIKTYQSDLFNNWISTEWIDGVDGISAITAIDTSGGSFTIDELNLSKKVYDMLNRIAISGGTYDDWLDAVYTHDRQKSVENPMYMGGLIKNVVFQEVISNAATAEQPLGTLAGRGRIGGGEKGGKVVCKVDEPSYIMGIVSLTPRIDYSQGNKWDMNLKTFNDLHKPALDEIGFQDLITDQMAFWDTKLNGGNITFKSAGKQPAWTNYMTNVDVVKGNFADAEQQMFMVLNRRYEAEVNEDNHFSIKDLTTYIDPVKCNYIFADTRRDAQNFWIQIRADITARRKMSAKIMPNL